jgi:DNA-binding beta-propeller fold protein YncE
VYVSVEQEFNPEKELGKEVVVWDPVAHRTSKCEIPAGSRILAHDSDREVLYVTSRHAPIVSVVDVRTLELVDALEYDASADYGRDITVGLAGEVYVTAWRDLVALTPDSSKLAGTTRTFEQPIYRVLPCGNDSLCVVFDTFVEVVAKRDLATTTIYQFSQSYNPTDFAVLPTGDLLIVPGGGDAVSIYDPETGTVRSLTIPGEYGRVAGTWEAVVCLLSTDGKQVFLVDTNTGEISEPVDLPSR